KKLLAGKDPTLVSWTAARRAFLYSGVDDPEDWKEKQAQKIVDALLKAKIGQGLVKDPEITALALYILNPRLPLALVREWWADDPDLKSAVAAELSMEDNPYELLEEEPEQPDAKPEL